MKKLILMAALAASLAACTSSPAKIKADEALPQSPCACGPRVYPLGVYPAGAYSPGQDTPV